MKPLTKLSKFGILSIGILSVITLSTVYAALSANVSGTGSIGGAANIQITGASWSSSMTNPGTCSGFPGTTITCTGTQWLPGDSADTLSVAVKNTGTTSALFTPGAMSITGDTGGFITTTTPTAQSISGGLTGTFIYTFAVSASATPESSISYSFSVTVP